MDTTRIITESDLTVARNFLVERLLNGFVKDMIESRGSLTPQQAIIIYEQERQELKEKILSQCVWLPLPVASINDLYVRLDVLLEEAIRKAKALLPPAG